MKYQTGATTVSSQTTLFEGMSGQTHLNFLEGFQLWNWNKYDNNFLSCDIQFLKKQLGK